MHHLFRPQGRWLFQWRRLSEGWVAAARRRATRQRHGHGLSRRSSNPRSGRDCRRQAARYQRRENHHQDSRSADFLGRCAAAAFCLAGAGCARVMARSLAHHLSRGPRSRESSSESSFELGLGAGQRRDRDHARIGPARGVGDPWKSL